MFSELLNSKLPPENLITQTHRMYIAAVAGVVVAAVVVVVAPARVRRVEGPAVRAGGAELLTRPQVKARFRKAQRAGCACFVG